MSVLRVEEVNGVVIAKLVGEIDLANARDVHAELTAAIPNSALGVVLDLSPTTYLDSSGIQLVFDLAERLGKRQQQLRVVVPEGVPIRRVLRVVELDSTVPVDAVLDDAEAAVRANA
jgi:anti-anti-sigma factor